MGMQDSLGNIFPPRNYRRASCKIWQPHKLQRRPRNTGKLLGWGYDVALLSRIFCMLACILSLSNRVPLFSASRKPIVKSDLLAEIRKPKVIRKQLRQGYEKCMRDAKEEGPGDNQRVEGVRCCLYIISFLPYVSSCSNRLLAYRYKMATTILMTRRLVYFYGYGEEEHLKTFGNLTYIHNSIITGWGFGKLPQVACEAK